MRRLLDSAQCSVQSDEGGKHVCLCSGSAVLGLQFGAFGVKSERKSATPSR
jgi:hypothetical protein